MSAAWIEAIMEAVPLLLSFALAGLSGYLIGYQKATKDITIVVRQFNEEQEARENE